jgi:hypothetical protein
MGIYYTHITSQMRVWLNGRISLCQGEDAGSIPATRLSVE